MSMYHRNALRSGNCRQCGRSIAIGDRIHVAKSRYATTTRCVVCRPEPGRPAVAPSPVATPAMAPEGPIDTTGPAAIEAATAILNDAPEHLRASLDAIRTAVASLTWLGCPREAVAAAILLGREDGARDYRATMAGDIAGKVASVIDTIGEPVLPTIVPAVDAFDAVDCTCPDAAPYAADTSGDDARAGSFDLASFADVLSIPDADAPVVAAMHNGVTIGTVEIVGGMPAIAQNAPSQAPEAPAVPSGRFRRVPATVRPVRDVAPLAPTVDGAPWG